MILFYSVHCKHCAMLLDSVRRLDTNGSVKQINIESLKHTHPNVYQQLQAVPALMILPSKELIYGKAVFDFLLLPTRGKLVSLGGATGGVTEAKPDAMGGSSSGTGVLHVEEGVMAFNGLTKSRGIYSDCFADINETEATPSDPANNPHSSFNWLSIDEMVRLGSDSPDIGSSVNMNKELKAGISSSQIATGDTGMSLETRAPRETVDVDSIRRERDKDLQALYAGQTMPI